MTTVTSLSQALVTRSMEETAAASKLLDELLEVEREIRAPIPASQRGFAAYLMPAEPPKIPEPERPPWYKRAVLPISNTLSGFYERRGQTHVNHYVRRYEADLVTEDGVIDKKAVRDLETMLQEALLEKQHHYGEEGFRFLKIYTGAAVVLVAIGATGAFVTTLVTTGGSLTAPTTIGVILVGTLTAIAGAAVTALLFAYRTDSLRKYFLKGQARLYVHRYQSEQEAVSEKEVAHMLACLTIDGAIKAKTGLEVHHFTMNSRKRALIEEAIASALLEHEEETQYLKGWSDCLRERVQEILEDPPEELLWEMTQTVEDALAQLPEDTPEFSSEEYQELRAQFRTSLEYQLTRTWVARRLLPDPAEALIPLVEPFLSQSEADRSHIHTNSKAVIANIIDKLEAGKLSKSTRIDGLERELKSMKRKNKELAAEVEALRLAVFGT